MTAFDFMSNSPMLTFFLFFLLVLVVEQPFATIRRYLRHKDIQAKGWPPAHCDSDGDFKDD